MPKSRIVLCLTSFCVVLMQLVSTEAETFSINSKGYTKEINSCEASLENITKRISADNRRISVSIDAEEITEPYSRMPVDRPYRIKVIMRGDRRDIENVMYSEKLLTSITKTVIDSCDRVSIISYGQFRTDYVRKYGLTLSGKVQRFECVDPRAARLQTLSWGQYTCL